MAVTKLFISLALVASFGLLNAAEADWEVLNLAIDNPGSSNPEILKNSILNILAGLGQLPTAPPTTTAVPCPQTVPSVSPTAATAPPTLPPTYRPIYTYYQPPQIVQQAPQAVQPVQQSPVYYQPQYQPFEPSKHHHHQKQPKNKAIAEFLVNVPCPTTTPKPIRQIVVKVPCPTTKKPCECQCCPCNPCKPPAKKKQYYKSSSEEESQEETKTVYKTYDPVVKKYVDAKRNDVPKTRSVSYQPAANYQRVHLKKDFDENLFKQ